MDSHTATEQAYKNGYARGRKEAAKSGMFEYMKKVTSKLPQEELLAGLGEEAAELAQAALKYRRTFSDVNPTPVPRTEALEHLYEEAGDVLLYLGVLDCISEVVAHPKVVAAMMAKASRWADRLEGRAKG